jgi:hypothetical protein
MTADAWATIRTSVARLAGCGSASKEKEIARQLESSRIRIEITKDPAERLSIAQLETEIWMHRFHDHLRENPDLAGELENILRIIKESSAPQSSPTIRQHIKAARDAYTAGGDLHIQLHVHNDDDQ